jgi:hypothetical protein
MIQAPEGITLYGCKIVFIIILPSQLQALEQCIERKLATRDQAIAGIRDPPVDGAADGKETPSARLGVGGCSLKLKQPYGAKKTIHHGPYNLAALDDVPENAGQA